VAVVGTPTWLVAQELLIKAILAGHVLAVVKLSTGAAGALAQWGALVLIQLEAVMAVQGLVRQSLGPLYFEQVVAVVDHKQVTLVGLVGLVAEPLVLLLTEQPQQPLLIPGAVVVDAVVVAVRQAAVGQA
jgi:hypothetical protein